MAGLRIPVGGALCTFELGGPGQDGEVLTTIGLIKDDPWVDGDAHNIYDDFVANVVASLATPLLIHACELRIQIDANDQVIQRWEEENNGSDGADMLPLNVSMLVKKLSGVAGRKNSGRMFIPGLREARVDDAGRLTSSFQAAMQTGVDAFYDALVADGWPPYIFHHGPGDPRAVTSLVVAGAVATQKGRLSRV